MLYYYRMTENLGDERKGACYSEVRRSVRCRTVNSIYAESIGEMRKTNRKLNMNKKLHHKTSFAENQESDDY